MGQANIVVVVRCRPRNARETAQGKSVLVSMDGNTTYLAPPDDAPTKETKSFAFDKSYWSACDPSDSPTYASQDTMHLDLGVSLLDHALAGYNACIIAYGQTGSGKSYTMGGTASEPGMVPHICKELFERIDALSSSERSFKVEVSYMEIYQERVRDLLDPSKTNLRVREHATAGPYVESLSKLAVSTYADVESFMEAGTRARTVAATAMNETSSRSHAIFTLVVSQSGTAGESQSGTAGEKTSRISLVDLAGSERANSTGATGLRLKEGALINKSLTTLGRVISALAAESTVGSSGKKGAGKVPYRDSVLTWLLKDSLGGNSRTTMVAAISPTDYEETLSTLRYADQAKRIVTKPLMNEDSNARLIRELREELASLRATADSTSDVSAKAEIQDRYEASSKLFADATETWQEKVTRSQKLQQAVALELEALGITIEKGSAGVRAPRNLPHLVNLSEDPLLAECLLYPLKRGRTVVGNVASETSDIRLSGASILSPSHAHFECLEDGSVTLHSRPNSITMVNGQRLSPSHPKQMKSGFRVIFGDFHIFRFNHPEEARRAREVLPPEQRIRQRLNSEEPPSTPGTRPESPVSTPLSTVENADWSYARREVLRLNGIGVDLDRLPHDELDKLFTSIVHLRHSRTVSTASNDQAESWTSPLPSSVTEDGDVESEGSPSRRALSRGTADTSLDLQQVEDQLAAITASYEERIKSMEYSAALSAQERRPRAKRVTSSPESEWTLLDERGAELGHRIIELWRRCRTTELGATVLLEAAVLKEANIVSRKLGKSLAFQFVVVGSEMRCSALSSSLAAESLFDVIDVTDEGLDSSRKPCVGIKVIDRGACTVSAWSLAKMRVWLERNRRLCYMPPAVSLHFSAEDPSDETLGYSLVGSALISLAPLARQISCSSTLQITSPWISDPIGTCRIRFKPSTGSSPPAQLTSLRDELSCEITVDRLTGFAKTEFSSLHLQLSLSSLLGPSCTGDEIFLSDAVDLARGSGELKLRRQFTVSLTPAIHAHLAHGYATISVYACVTEAHLDKIERWDSLRDETSRVPNSPSIRGDPLVSDVTRRAESELVGEVFHDILATVQVLELDASGEYVPVPVLYGALDGTACLRQGLQRRFVLTLSHSSGKSWPWRTVTGVSLGSVQLVDGRGRTHASPSASPDAMLQAMREENPSYADDGTATLLFDAPWDSSVHNSPFLNRTTASDSRVTLELRFSVDADNLTAPVAFVMPVAVSIASRDSWAVSKFTTLFNSSRIARTMTAIYSVRLAPAMPRSLDIWRLDTAETHVRGEEILGGWRPRGLSLVRDYKTQQRSIRVLADVQAVTALLDSLSKGPPTLAESVPSEVRLARALALWQKHFGTRREISLDRQSSLEASNELSSSGTSRLAAPPPKLTGRVTAIPSTLSSHTGGTLIMLVASTGEWRKFWAVVRQPYLHLFETSSETDRIGVPLNLATAKAESSAEIDQLLGRKHLFGLFTRQNSFYFQTPSEQVKLAWLAKLS